MAWVAVHNNGEEGIYANRDWCYCIADLHAVTAEMGMYMSEDNYSTYEEALEEGLKRSFELIKK